MSEAKHERVGMMGEARSEATSRRLLNAMLCSIGRRCAPPVLRSSSNLTFHLAYLGLARLEDQAI